MPDPDYIQGMADDSGIYADECNYDPRGHLNSPHHQEIAMATKPPPVVEDVAVKGEPPAPAQTGTEVAHWKDRMVALTKQTKAAEKPQGGFISLKGGRMTYADEILPGDKINAIIVDYRKDNEFYDKPYDAKTPATPRCWAIVRPHEELAPGEDVPEEDRQAPSCDVCPRNEWGSDLKGGKGKACKTSRRLHLFAADDCQNPEEIKKAAYMTMIPPATSTDNFQKLANQITGVLDCPIFGAVVEISVKPHDKFLYMVHYKIIEQIKDPGLLMALLARHETISQKPVVMPKPDAPEADRAARGATSGKF